MKRLFVLFCLAASTAGCQASRKDNPQDEEGAQLYPSDEQHSACYSVASRTQQAMWNQLGSSALAR